MWLKRRSHGEEGLNPTEELISLIKQIESKYNSGEEIPSNLLLHLNKLTTDSELLKTAAEHSPDNPKQKEIIDMLEKMEDMVGVQESAEHESKEEEKTKTFEDLVLLELKEIMSGMSKKKPEEIK